MKINIPKQWFEEKVPLEGDGEIGAGNPHFMKEKLTWADKVRYAIRTSPELQERIRTFDTWKHMVKSQPEKYRITHFAREFTLEEAIVIERNDNFTVKWISIDETPRMHNTIWWYIWKL